MAATSRHSKTLVLPSQILGPHPFHSPLQLVILGPLSFIFRLPMKSVIVDLLPGREGLQEIRSRVASRLPTLTSTAIWRLAHTLVEDRLGLEPL